MAKKRDWSNEVEDTTSEAQETEPVKVEKPKIPFEHWVGKLIKAGKLKWYDDDALLIFLKNQGLTKNEDEDTYNRAFAKF